MKQYLIIGNGIAGWTAAEHIRENDSLGRITIVGNEPLPLYSRIRLPEYISGAIKESALIIKSAQAYNDRGIDLMTNTSAINIDSSQKFVITDKDEKLSYDSLLLATGSHSFIPPIKGADKENVFSVRNVIDARKILSAENIENIVIVGGGLLGLETGNALLKLGKKVTVLETNARLLPRQLDFKGAKKLQAAMEKIGFNFRIKTTITEISGRAKVDKVCLESSEELPADMVIISAGVRSNLSLAKKIGLDIDRGIKVNHYMLTSKPDIFAAGDVAQFNEQSYCIWPAAVDQGKTAGLNMAGKKRAYRGITPSNILKVGGIELASAGNIDPENRLQSRIVSDDKVYKKIVIDNDRIVGCIMLGDKKDFKKIVKAINEKQSISETGLF